MFEFAEVTLVHDIATVVINRPERKNALHPAAHHELDAIFDQLAANKALRCVIVTGAGDAFCAGYDLHDNLQTGVMEIAKSGFGGIAGRTDYPLPVIAAVNGVAMGGGFEIALACDIILATPEAHFALPEAKVGWSPLGGGLQRLPRAVGEKRALALVLTGRAIDAVEAERIGLVAEVVTREELMPTAHRWAQEIAACAPLAIACNREVIRGGMTMPLADALDIENFPSAARVMDSSDADEGKRAFFEKRRALWQGR